MKLQTISLIASTVVASAAALAVFGVKEVPRWAWHSEHLQLAGDLTELDSRITAQQLQDKKLEKVQNLIKQSEDPVPEVKTYLLEQEVLIDQQIYDLQKRLDGLGKQGG